LTGNIVLSIKLGKDRRKTAGEAEKGEE